MEDCAMDACFTAIVGFMELVLGGMGVYVSLKPPKQEHHWYWIGAFMGVGLLGVALNGWLAQRGSSAQEKATGKITEAVMAASNANVAATNANNSVLAADRELADARDEARKAKDGLSKLINQRSRETAKAILELGTSTTSSINAITPIIRTIVDDATKAFKLILSA